MVKSIIPVLTKVDPKDENFDMDGVRDDLRKIMDGSLQRFLNELMYQGEGNEQLKITIDEIDLYEKNKELSLEEIQEIIPLEKLKGVKEYCERKQFYECFES